MIPTGTRPDARSFQLLGSAQAALALIAGILLFAVPLYLWRRPRATPQPSAEVADASPRDAAPAPPVAEVTRPLPVKLADARVLECHDRGAKKTPPEQCDHVPPFEKALGDAIEAAHDCVPKDAGAGAIEYVADLSFGRRRKPVILALPRDGRTFQSPKIVKDCTADVRARLGALQVATLPHAHARYKIAVVASYGSTAL